MKNLLKNFYPLATLTCVVVVSFSMTSCDAPRSERQSRAGRTSTNLFGDPISTTTAGDYGSDSSTGGDDGGSTTGGVEQVNVPSEVSHCNWSMDGNTGFQSSSAHMSPTEDNASEGAFTLCQSSTSPNDVFLQVKNPVTDSQVCIIPTYSSGSNSVYVGEPRCLYVRDDQTLYKVNLIKNRTGFTSYPINGVMMMKDKAYQYGAPFYQVILSPDAYIFCSQWLAQYGDPSYCIPFKSAGHYVYHEF